MRPTLKAIEFPIFSFLKTFENPNDLTVFDPGTCYSSLRYPRKLILFDERWAIWVIMVLIEWMGYLFSWKMVHVIFWEMIFGR